MNVYETGRPERRAELQKDRIVVYLRYGDSEKEEVKGLGGRYDAGLQCWYLPARLDVFEAITAKCPRIAIQRELAERAADWKAEAARAAMEAELRLIAAGLDAPGFKVPGLRGDLFPYQRDGVRWAELCGGRALIADEMGLGKTVQALAYLQLHPEARPALIVCPAAVRGAWAAEAERWLEERPENHVAVIRTGKDRPGSAITVCNYDLVHQLPADEYQPVAVVLDECHYIKEPSARRTKAVLAVARHAKHVVALSGTPMLGRPRELFTTLHLLRPDVWPDRRKFEERYCGGHYEEIRGRMIWKADGAYETAELNDLLRKHVMIRREKAKVLDQLPAKIRSTIQIEASELDNAAEYRRAEQEFANWLLEHKLERAQVLPGAKRPEEIELEVWQALQAEALVRLNALRQLAGIGKIGAAVKWAQDFLDGSDDQKLVIFAHHQEVQQVLHQQLKGYGAVLIAPGEDYAKAVERFQNEAGCRVAVCSLRGAGQGITLTAASYMLLVELDWTPGQLDQAEDRIHRIGQEAETCNYYYLTARGTIDDDMQRRLERKRTVTRQVLAMEELERVQRQDLIAKARESLTRMGLTPLELLMPEEIDQLVSEHAATPQAVPQVAGATTDDVSWLDLAEAVAYARARGARIERAHLIMDIQGRVARGRRLRPFFGEGDVRRVFDAHVKGGFYWQVKREALDRRIAQRAQGRYKRQV